MEIYKLHSPVTLKEITAIIAVISLMEVDKDLSNDSNFEVSRPVFIDK